MVTTFRIAKIYLKEMIGSIISGSQSAESARRGSGKFRKILLLLLPLLFLPQLFVMSKFMYEGLKSVGLESLSISIMTLAASMTVFMSVFASVITSIGGDAAVTQLLSQPVKSKQLFHGRMLLMYIIAMLESLYLLLSMSVIYAMDFGWHTLAYSLIVSLITPAIPMSICLIFVSPFARFLVSPRLKKIVPYILNIGFLALYFWFITATSPQNMEGVDVSSGFVGVMAQVVSKYYPPAAFAGEFVSGNLVSGAFYLALSALSAAVAMWISGFFAKIMLHEGGSKPAAIKKGSVSMESRSVMSRLFRRQLQIMFSSHRFVLQSFGSLFIMPILMVVYIAMGLIDVEMLRKMLEMSDGGMILLFLLMFSPSAFSFLGATSIAREGATFWESKVMPVSGRMQVASRFYFSMVMTVPVSLIMAVAATIMLELSWLDFAISALMAVGLICFFTSLDHLIDIAFPNIVWTNELQAVKNSKTIGIAMIVKMLLIGALGGGHFLIAKYSGMQAVFISLFVCGVLLGAIGVSLLFTKGVRMFDKIEA